MANVGYPVHAEVEIDLTGCEDPVAIKNFAVSLMQYLRQHQTKDWPGLTVKCKVSGPVVTVVFDGESQYAYYPGSGPSYSSGGEPDDIDGLFDLDDVESYVEDVLKEIPDMDVPGVDYTSEAFLKSCVSGNERASSIPDWDDIYAAYCDTFYPSDYEDDSAYDRWKDSKLEGVINLVLAGKRLTEALNEREDWDVSAEELYAPTDAEIAQDAYEKELNDFRKKAKGKLLDFKVAVRELSDVFKGCNDYDIPYFDAEGCPFKNLASLVNDCDTWVNNIAEMIDGGTK